jgi:SdpI/YfhL protein family
MVKYIIAPLLIVAVAIPMILGVVPPNGIYGFRTSYTLSSEDVWYRANRISGIATVVAAWCGSGSFCSSRSCSRLNNRRFNGQAGSVSRRCCFRSPFRSGWCIAAHERGRPQNRT